MRKIITISREFGSGGRELGKRLAEALGMAYYDREIVTALAEKSGLAEEYIENVSERGIPRYYPITYARTFTRLPAFSEPHMKVLNEQNRLLLELAGKSDCVIVGRCADVILREYQPLKLFVYASPESKMQRCRLREEEGRHYTDRELKRRMAQIDSGRARYRELTDGNKWGEKSGYHLCINTTELEIKSLVGAVCEFASCYFDEKKQGMRENH
ncbi:MAG: cytidylate kinase-like family protein [Eubacteriales bacterium]|nr:cytidylate kinase-like family protein [Eubacteriales bacterium]